MAKYSFVLPAYKSTFLKEAIDSILAQTYQDFELIIVNDASPENLDSIVQKYNDPRISYYVNEQNVGGIDLVAQWNHSISYATGEYLILASDDDVYLPTYLEKMDVLTQNYPNVYVFRPRIQIIDKNGNIQRINGCISEKVSWIEYWYFWDIIGSSIGHFIFNRKKLIENGGFVNFPMGWGSDDATVLKIGYNGICFNSNILYSFRMSGENISSKYNDHRTVLNKIKARKQFYDWLKEQLKEYQPKGEIEEIFHQASTQRLNNIFQSITLDLVNNTSIMSSLRVMPILLKLDYTLTSVVIKRILLKIIRYFL